MALGQKLHLYLTGVLVLVCAALVVDISCVRSAARRRELELLNRVAELSKTVEIAKGVNDKLTVDVSSAEAALDESRVEAGRLKASLEQRDAEVLYATEMAIGWKRAYEGKLPATQTHVGPASQPTTQPTTQPVCAAAGGRERVDFAGELGPVSVTGHTLTDPAEAFVNLKQTRPLVVALALSRDAEGKWHTTVSTDESMDVDVRVAAVDTRLLARKWYEGLSVGVALGTWGADTDRMAGALWVAAEIGDFSVGPAGFVTDGGLAVGAKLEWRPFSRGR